jgi:DNA polymerase III delta subunit
MHSKWQIWDFFSSYDRGTLATYEGALALNTFDPQGQRLVKEHLLKGIGRRVVHHKSASEITRSWIEAELMTLSLFGNSDSFFIHGAQDLSAELMAMIPGLDLSGRFLLLSFENEGASWKRLLKEGKISVLEIEAPRFWEVSKLLDFTCAYLRLPISYEAKSWMLESLENDFGTFYNSCSLIKLNHPDAKEVSLKDVIELLTTQRLDQFALASLYARRKAVPFFEKLVALEGDFERMRGLFNFLQSHLVKMADLGYLRQKPRLTQYDKDLQGSSGLWKSEEIMKEIQRFNRWELMCKKKDQLIWHEIREEGLRSIGRV